MNFNRFVTGFVVGNLIGMASAALTSRNNRKNITKVSRDWMVRIGNIVDDIADIYK